MHSIADLCSDGMILMFFVFLFFQAKANPELAAANKASADAKRERRKESGSTKEFK
jgi:hypothetical protein